MTELATTDRGDRVAYDRYGDGPAVVLVSGAGSLRGDETTTATARLVAAEGLTVLVGDRLGRGESVPSGRLDLDREVDALRALLEVAGGRAVLCGHSSGSAISLCAAATGLAVDGLVLWEAPVAAPASETAAWVDGLERRLDDDELEAAQEWCMKDMPPEWLAGAKVSPAWPAIYAGVVSLRADGQSLRWVTGVLESGSLRDQVGVTVLAVHGTSTLPMMVAAAARLHAMLPQTEVREVAGADHVWEPTAFAPVLVVRCRSCFTFGGVQVRASKADEGGMPGVSRPRRTPRGACLGVAERQETSATCR